MPPEEFNKPKFDWSMPELEEEDGTRLVWDPTSKTYVPATENFFDKHDTGHSSGGDNNLFDPAYHTEKPGNPLREGILASNAPDDAETAEKIQTHAYDAGLTAGGSMAKEMMLSMSPEGVAHTWEQFKEDPWQVIDPDMVANPLSGEWAGGDNIEQMLVGFGYKRPTSSDGESDLEGEAIWADVVNDFANIYLEAYDEGLRSGFEQALAAASQTMNEPGSTYMPPDWEKPASVNGPWRDSDEFMGVEPADPNVEIGHGPAQEEYIQNRWPGLTWSECPECHDHKLIPTNFGPHCLGCGYWKKDRQARTAATEVVCPNCKTTTTEIDCPECNKFLGPEWAKINDADVFSDIPVQHRNPSGHPSDPERVPKENRDNLDRSFPSILSSNSDFAHDGLYVTIVAYEEEDRSRTPLANESFEIHASAEWPQLEQNMRRFWDTWNAPGRIFTIESKSPYGSGYGSVMYGESFENSLNYLELLAGKLDDDIKELADKERERGHRQVNRAEMGYEFPGQEEGWDMRLAKVYLFGLYDSRGGTLAVEAYNIEQAYGRAAVYLGLAREGEVFPEEAGHLVEQRQHIRKMLEEFMPSLEETLAEGTSLAESGGARKNKDGSFDLVGHLPPTDLDLVWGDENGDWDVTIQNGQLAWVFGDPDSDDAVRWDDDAFAFLFAPSDDSHEQMPSTIPSDWTGSPAPQDLVLASARDNLKDEMKPRDGFAHYDEEFAWKLANEPDLADCPECSGKLLEKSGEKICHDCGLRQPIITEVVSAVLAPLAVGAGELAGGAAAGVAAGEVAGVAGGAAAGGGAVASGMEAGNIGRVMQKAMTRMPSNETGGGTTLEEGGFGGEMAGVL